MDIQKYVRLLAKPKDAMWRIRKRMPNVVHTGRRAITSCVTVRGTRCVKKTFEDTEVGLRCYQTELLAHQLFKNRSWMPPLVKKGRRWLAVPWYEEDRRLDRAVTTMDEGARLEVARQALAIAFDLFMGGYAHCDFHAANLYWDAGRLVLSDFETMQRYPDGGRPSFPTSYDLVAQGLASPFMTNRMCYAAQHDHYGRSLEKVLGIPLEVALPEFGKDLKNEIRDACLQFKARTKRHTCRAGRIYSSFALAHLVVPASETQRDNAKRLARFGVTADGVKGRSVLDLGSNVGGVLFEIQKHQPGRCLGVEYDASKVQVARRVAAFNGLDNVCFDTADIDKLRASETGGPFDIVLCLAIEAHVKNRKRLYRLLGEVTREVLYFEGNAATNVDQVTKLLSEAGFQSVQFLGLSDDDCLPDNNCRPLWVARK